MELYKAIKYLFPDASHETDFMIRDDSDGKGPYIAQWHLPQPQPTQAELEAAWEQVKNAPQPPTVQEQIDELTLALADIYAGGV